MLNFRCLEPWAFVTKLGSLLVSLMRHLPPPSKGRGWSGTLLKFSPQFRIKQSDWSILNNDIIYKPFDWLIPNSGENLARMQNPPLPLEGGANAS